MKTDEIIESFRAIMALANKGLSAPATAEQRAEQQRPIEAETAPQRGCFRQSYSARPPSGASLIKSPSKTDSTWGEQ
jgi:hypothetical protein